MIVVPLTLRQANDFVELHHRHSARTANDGGKFAIGLTVDDELIGVAIVGRPVARMLAEVGTAEVLRLCVTPAAPKGACARLYARCKRIWQQMGGRRLVTYTLARERGASLRGAGFIIEAVVPARSWSTPSRPRPARALDREAKVRWGCELSEVPA